MAGDILELERAIKQLPGVLGCVIMTEPDGSPSEIQAFVSVGVDQSEVQNAIRAEAARRAADGALRQVLVYELEAESHFGDRETLARAAELAEQEARARGPARARPTPPAPPAVPTGEPGRPRFDRVVLTSSMWTSESQVALNVRDREIVGSAEGEKTPHGLKVLAQATLDACHQLLGGIHFRLTAASLVSLADRQAVLVLVHTDELETLGAALVRDRPISEAAVRATLAAVNRRLAREAT